MWLKGTQAARSNSATCGLLPGSWEATTQTGNWLLLGNEPLARRRRELTPEEQALWDHVTRQVEALERSSQPVPPQRALPKQPSPSADAPLPLRPFRIGSKAALKVATATGKPSFVDRPTQTSPNMDRRNFQRLLKGRLDIDATLDLHGLTADQAQTRLHMFVKAAYGAGHRLLLIITGKGQRGSEDEFNRPRRGVLRSGVPEWLRTGALSGIVLQVTQAHPRHGGGGAFYVYLRRKR